MVGEAELIKSAQGDFFLTLVAFLIIALVLGFFFFMKLILDQNAKRDDQMISRMDQLVASVTNYQDKTVSTFCEKLEKHDDQAKEILKIQEKTLTTLENRPCVQVKSGG